MMHILSIVCSRESLILFIQKNVPVFTLLNGFSSGECETVDCVPSAWSSWSSECGKGQRVRSINPMKKTIKKYSCQGVKTTCEKDEEKEERNTKCTCSYVDCQFGQWSEWSSECGDASRSRPINAVVKTVEKYSCDGLQQTCPKKEEVEDRSTKC